MRRLSVMILSVIAALVVSMTAAFPASAKPAAAAALLPTITGITPASGSTAGGTTVTVAGANLTGASRVAFGATAGTSLTVVSPTQLRVTSPAHAAGPVDVRVTTVDGTSAVVTADRYSYVVPSCQGRTATIDGTAGDDTLTGTAGNDVVVAAAGNDKIDGLGGDDVICPGLGDDRVTGGTGTHTVVFDGTAGATANVATGSAKGQGTDSLAGLETLTGGPGSDTLTGNSAVNQLRGSGGTDTCVGGAGADIAVDCEIGLVNFDGAGSKDTYLYTVAAAGQAIWLDSLNAAPVGGLAVWTMANSGGIIPGNTNAANDTVVESTRTGQHTLTVSGSLTSTTGSLRFQVHFPVDTGGPIAPASTLAAATPVPVPITQPGMNARFTFDVSGTDVGQGRVIAAQLVVSPWTIVTPGFSILGPGGVPVVGGTLTATTIVTGRLTAAGQYTVLINPSLVSTGSGSLKVAVTPIDLARQIVPGSSLGGAPVIRTAVNEVGQDLRFTFDVSGTDVGQGRVIAAQLVVSPWTIVASGFQILGPGGALLTNGVLAATTIRTGRLTASGQYTVLINPAGVSTGSGTLKVAVCTSAANC